MGRGVALTAVLLASTLGQRARPALSRRPGARAAARVAGASAGGPQRPSWKQPSADGEWCYEKSMSGGSLVAPRGGAVDWSSGAAAVEGAECVTAERGAGVRQTCCRPTAAKAAEMGSGPAHRFWAHRLARLPEARRGDAGSWRCLPSLVVIGAQKCGSTALAGYLTHHPEVAFAASKEVHYFDKNESLCKGALPYLLNFPAAETAPGQQLQQHHHHHRFRQVTAEATPFYIASPTACGEMRRQIPHARLVLLVREPVARALSEYEMKHRRVVAQEAFRRGLEAQSRGLRDCFLETGPGNITLGLPPCLGEELSASSKFALFLRVVKRATQKGRFLDWVGACFEEGVVGGATTLRFRTERCFKQGVRESLQPLEGIMIAEIAAIRACAAQKFGWRDPPDLASATRLIEACVHVQTSISGQYVYRGLYAAQLNRCFRSGVPAAQLAIVDSEDLRNNPRAVLDRIADFAGVRRHTYDEALFDPQVLRAKILETFPTFENTGWRLDSRYAHAMTPALEKNLHAFFKPHNAFLYAIAGRDLHWDPRAPDGGERG